MPSRAKKPCRRLGCRELVVGVGYCEEHKKERGREWDSRRGTAAERGYGHRWRQARLVHLGSEPLCRACLGEGVVRAGNQVDHIVPHRGDAGLFWDRGNWQTLCDSHHSQKTASGK